MPYSFGTSRATGGPARAHSMALAVTFFSVFLEHRPRCYFLGPVPVTPRLFGAFLDMFVLPLLLGAYPAYMFFPWHLPPLPRCFSVKH